ncbi:hypothetical protein GCM10012275_07670 [Longimycelium tulufanense]|uniref:Uncharacterized protein n=1 Tax=Longimycelium tulufanense TaxID=907463 RepID=A0A8J3C6B9_9PSEU|nr:hypothetical protein GCM10012275_07670 [Longimycelium tulufanense]
MSNKPIPNSLRVPASLGPLLGSRELGVVPSPAAGAVVLQLPHSPPVWVRVEHLELLKAALEQAGAQAGSGSKVNAPSNKTTRP